jgi:two-component system, OmpR family, sensor histidine kinase KdpD
MGSRPMGSPPFVIGEPQRAAEEEVAERERRDGRARRGRLKIFFGAAPGVGKTYTMLEAARHARQGGLDVVVGYVEPHGRADIESLLLGLPQLPSRQTTQGGSMRRDLDLDAARRRSPALLLVDELAHSNGPESECGPRHAKRWQDIQELLAARIDVWTTLNVQHLESLNDVVAGITGVRQEETIPDRVFDEADEVELVDLPPTELLARLRAGKVYPGGEAPGGSEQFFREPNLVALRELALRRTADRVDAAARAYGGKERASKPWLARDRFLVAVAPDEQAEQLVRLGKRFADAMDAEWMVVSVETPAMLKLGERARNRRVDVLRLAESLGAETVTLDGPSAAATLSEYAGLRNVTRIVVGEPKRARWWFAFRPSTAIQLMRTPRAFDVSSIAFREPSGPASPEAVVDPRGIAWSSYAAGLPISIACTALAALMFRYFSLTDLVMVYLLGATIAALRLGRGPAAMVAVINTLAFDFMFVPPRYSLAVSNFNYVVTFGVMLAVALIIATLVASVRAQTRVAGARERRTSLLYGMSRELVATRGFEPLTRVAIKHVAETFAGRAAVLLPDEEGRLIHQPAPAGSGSLRDADVSIAQWVFDHDTPAGLGTDTLPGAPAQYLPLRGSGKVLGVLAVEPSHRRRLLLPEQRHLLDTFAGQIALALERAVLADEAERARVSAETESLRNTLLASISHDLRTPLAVIAGASSALNDESTAFDEHSRRLLASSIESKANEMTQIISNVLDLMRLEAGNVVLRRDWQTVDDLIGLALERLKTRLVDHPVQVDLPAELPPVYVDGALMLQVFTNLLENAAKHTPPKTRITIRASAEEAFVRVVVDDTGPGLPGDAERLFEKFQRGRDEGNTGGAGLGLAICRAIVNLHGGRIEAARRAGGGARFTFTLPVA